MLFFKKAILTFALTNSLIAPYEMPFLANNSTLSSSIDSNAKMHSSVEDDLEKMNYDLSKASNDSLLTITRSDEYVYFYFKLSKANVKRLSAVLSYVDTLNSEKLYDDKFNSFSLIIVSSSSKDNYYKAISTDEKLLTTKRIKFKSASYLNETEDEVLKVTKERIFYFDNNNVEKTIETKQIEILDPYSAYYTLSNETAAFSKKYPPATVLNYMFFDTSIDEDLEKAKDTITDVNVSYYSFYWECKLSLATSLIVSANSISTQPYENIKNNSNVYDFSESTATEKTKSIQNDESISVTHKKFYGERIYTFDCLFKTEESNDQWVIQENNAHGNKKWGLMFLATTQFNYYLQGPNYYRIQGEHVSKVKILTISYIDEGVAHKNVAVYDTYHNLVNGGYVDGDKADHEDELNDFFKMLKMITDFFNNIAAFFVNIGTWLANNPWAFYSILALILLLILSPLIGLIIDLLRRKK